MSIYLGTSPIAVNSSSRNIGEIIQSTIPLSDAGLHLLDGSLISGSGSYSAFVTYVAGLVSSYPDLFETEANWQNSVTTYGVCGKFVYDSVNNTVRLPKITGFTEGTIDPTVLGDLVEAGLPNITGYFYPRNNAYGTYWDNDSYENGALYKIPLGETTRQAGSSSSNYNTNNALGLDASKSSSIYGNSTTVQPQSIKALYYIVIATSVKTNIEVDIDDIATDLNGKADVDLSNCTKPHIVETYVNGTSWYRVYSDGWCEQGDSYASITSNSSIALLKNYVDTNYSVFIMRCTTSSSSTTTGGDWWTRTKTTSSFTPYTNQLSSPPYNGCWQACGYIS